MFPAAIGCGRPEVRNGKVRGLQSTYKAGETLRFSCDTGYAPEGPYESQCQPGGTWDPPVLVCQRGECGSCCPPRGWLCPAQCSWQAGAVCAGRAAPAMGLTHRGSTTPLPFPLRSLLPLR